MSDLNLFTCGSFIDFFFARAVHRTSVYPNFNVGIG